MRRLLAGLVLAAAVPVLVACLPQVETYACSVDDQCGDGRRCVDGSCVTDERPDAAPPPAFVRDVCVVGPAMPGGRDPCVDAVCTASPACCTLGWTEACVQRAATTCTPAPGTSGGRCPADVTVAGFGTLSTVRFRADPVRPSAVHCYDQLEGGPETGFTATAAWADADGDGDVELAIAGLGSLRVLEGRGVTGGGRVDQEQVVQILDPSPRGDTAYLWGSRLAWGDADHDGDLDLAWFDEKLGLRVLRRAAGAPVRYDETWLITTAEMPATARPVAVGWMQLDDDLDLELVANRGDRFWLYDRQPDERWTASEGPAGAAAFVASLDRLVTLGSRVFYAGNRALVPGPVLDVTAPQSWAWADLEGDGQLDLVGSSFDGLFWAPVRTGGFEAVRQVSTAARRRGVAVADLDGDGELDLFAPSDQALYAPVILLGDGDGTFAARDVTVAMERGDAQPVTLRGVTPLGAGLCQR